MRIVMQAMCKCGKSSIQWGCDVCTRCKAERGDFKDWKIVLQTEDGPSLVVFAKDYFAFLDQLNDAFRHLRLNHEKADTHPGLTITDIPKGLFEIHQRKKE